MKHNTRVILSLSTDDVDSLNAAVCSWDSTPEQTKWASRLQRITEHLKDEVPIRFTDLGEEL